MEVREAREKKGGRGRVGCAYGQTATDRAGRGLRRGAAVSAQLHKLAEQGKSDPCLHKEMAEIVAQLQNARGQLLLCGLPLAAPLSH